MTLNEIAAFLANQIMDREREARNLFVEAREGKDIDGKRMTMLLEETKLLENAYKALNKGR